MNTHFALPALYVGIPWGLQFCCKPDQAVQQTDAEPVIWDTKCELIKMTSGQTF